MSRGAEEDMTTAYNEVCWLGVWQRKIPSRQILEIEENYTFKLQ